MMKKKTKVILGLVALAIIVLLVGIYFIYIDIKSQLGDAMSKIDTKSSEFLNVPEKPQKITPVNKDSLILMYIDSVARANRKYSGKLSGKRISILITGVDSRIGQKSRRADANHLVNIWLDSAFVEVISIPRATKVYEGRPYLANLRAIEGPESYKKAVCKIAGIDTINYTVEFGLSQAIGLLELLGYKNNAVQVLRTLRSRKTFGPGDYQRSYNQGQFIRQMILKVFPTLDNFSMDVMLRGGLALVETNLDISNIYTIINDLKKKGFPRSDNDVIVELKPEYRWALKTFNFTDKDSIDKLYKHVARLSKNPEIAEDTIKDSKYYSNTMVSGIAERKVRFLITNAQKHIENNPKAVISKLETPVRQRVWYQVSNIHKRNKYRNEICKLLIKAYNKTGDTKKAGKIGYIMDSENKIYNLLHKPKKDTVAVKDTLAAKNTAKKLKQGN